MYTDLDVLPINLIPPGLNHTYNSMLNVNAHRRFTSKRSMMLLLFIQ
jgi:hypothetical protein